MRFDVRAVKVTSMAWKSPRCRITDLSHGFPSKPPLLFEGQVRARKDGGADAHEQRWFSNFGLRGVAMRGVFSELDV